MLIVIDWRLWPAANVGHDNIEDRGREPVIAQLVERETVVYNI